MDDEWVATNRAFWDERAPLHAGSEFYDLDDFRRRPDRLRPYEVEDIGDVTGRTLLHLQCHIGTDTLSWATRGARVVGIDFSAPAIATAQGMAAELGYDDGRAEFIVSDVYGAPAALGGRTFDLVYTGIGALNWLPDIQRWADVATGLVAPGGRLYLVEMHPFTWVFGDDDLTIEHGYWSQGRYVSEGSYVDRDAATSANVTVERNATIGEVVTAIAARGLVVRSLREHGTTVCPRWPWLERHGLDDYRQPVGRPDLPLMWSLLAERPATA